MEKCSVSLLAMTIIHLLFQYLVVVVLVVIKSREMLLRIGTTQLLLLLNSILKYILMVKRWQAKTIWYLLTKQI